MKRSSNIKLLLMGGLAVGTLTGCDPKPARISSESVYGNDFRVAGVGYYHAPFHAFYPQPYNYYDPVRKQYFYGGQWGPMPYESIINLSSPSLTVAALAEASRTDISRGGFGGSGGGFIGS